MNINAELPFEFEIVADYLKGGDSVIYLTRHDPGEITNALKRLGLKSERIEELLCFKTPDTPLEELGEMLSKRVPKRVMVDSISDLFYLRSFLNGGHLSCKINGRPKS